MSSPTRPEPQHVSREAPKHPQYQTYSSRLESFVNWPARYVPKTPEQLATAGFFYIGSADRVTCFQCGITLRDWKEEHDPEAEHERYSEHCQFIKKTEHSTDDPNNNQSCFDFITQLKFIANKIFYTDLDPVAAKDVSNIEVKVSPITRPGEDSATFLKTTDKYEDDNIKMSSPGNANARKRSTGEQSRLCRLCTNKDVSVIFLPCGHLVTCSSCANKIDKCMVCEANIRGRSNAAGR